MVGTRAVPLPFALQGNREFKKSSLLAARKAVKAKKLDASDATRQIALVWRRNSPRRNDFELLAEELRAG